MNQLKRTIVYFVIIIGLSVAANTHSNNLAPGAWGLILHFICFGPTYYLLLHVIDHYRRDIKKAYFVSYKYIPIEGLFAYGNCTATTLSVENYQDVEEIIKNDLVSQKKIKEFTDVIINNMIEIK